jgi:hypothetical protein
LESGIFLRIKAQQGGKSEKIEKDVRFIPNWEKGSCPPFSFDRPSFQSCSCPNPSSGGSRWLDWKALGEIYPLWRR